MAATGAQLRMIYGMAKKIGMDNDELHCMVHGLTGCESLRALDTRQGARVIDRLNALAGVERTPPNRASPAQQRMILGLARDMGWMEDPARLRGFLESRAGVSDVRYLPPAAAGRIIEAMKAMKEGGRAERRRHSGGLEE